MLIAAGNHGDGSNILGLPDSSAVRVGAAERDGLPWDKSGDHHQLLAPGVDLLLCQPTKKELGRHMLGCYSGTSFAVAITAGILVLLKERSGETMLEVRNRLLDRSVGAMIRVD